MSFTVPGEKGQMAEEYTEVISGDQQIINTLQSLIDHQTYFFQGQVFRRRGLRSVSVSCLSISGHGGRNLSRRIPSGPRKVIGWAISVMP
jgi:hypothetical protein